MLVWQVVTVNGDGKSSDIRLIILLHAHPSRKASWSTFTITWAAGECPLPLYSRQCQWCEQPLSFTEKKDALCNLLWLWNKKLQITY